MWLKGAEPGEPLTPDLRDHPAQCARCGNLTAAYRLAVDTVREAVDGHQVMALDMASIRAQLHFREHSPRRWKPAPWAAAAAVAAAVLAGTVWWTLQGDGSPVAGNAGPGRSNASGTARVEPGSVFAARSVSGNESPGDPSYPVHSGQVIETAESTATVSDSRIGTVDLSPNSRLRIGAWNSARTVLHLDRGLVEVDVVLRHTGQIFEVRTEFVTIRVVGTRFHVAHEPGSQTTIISIDGRLHVDTFAGHEVASMAPGRIMKVGPSRVIGPMPADREIAMAPGPRAVVMPRISNSRPAVRNRKKEEPPVAQADKGNSPAPRAPQTSVEEAVARARSLLAHGKSREAVDYLMGFQGGAGNSRVLALLGDAYQLDGKLEEARRAYEKALSAGPSHASESVLVDLAMLYQEKLGSPEGARGAWRRYLDSYPGGRYAGQALYGLAELVRETGGNEEALRLLRQLVREAPGSSEAVRALSEVGLALSRQGRAEDAAAWFGQFKGSPSKNLAQAALVGLMRVRAQQGDKEAVLSLGREHVRRFHGGKWKRVVEDLMDGAAGNP